MKIIPFDERKKNQDKNYKKIWDEHQQNIDFEVKLIQKNIEKIYNNPIFKYHKNK